MRYYDVFFSKEPIIQNGSPLERALEIEDELYSTIVHESGHAVVGYVLGLGLRYVGITANTNGSGIAFAGEVRFRKQRRPKPIKDIRYCPAILSQGVSTCAGPIAEYQHRRTAGLPFRMLGGTRGDHEFMNACGKALHANEGRGGHSFQRLSFMIASKLIQQPEIWDTIGILAESWREELDSTAFVDWLENAAIGNNITIDLSVTSAKALLRANGLRPNMYTLGLAAPCGVLATYVG